MTHSANELQHSAQILAADCVTIKASGLHAGVEDLSGRRLEQAQLIASETSHMILFRRNDVGGILDSSCYVVLEGATYIVDYMTDPRKPRPNMWVEVYCHVEGLEVIGALVPSNAFLLETGGTLDMEDGSGPILLEG